MLKRETSKNDIVEQIIERKFGDNFTVTHKTMTQRKGLHFSPYSRSRADLCIQHKERFFKDKTIRAGLVTYPDSLINAEMVERDVTTSIMEFKMGMFTTDQTLAEMLCTLTDCCVDTLKQGNQINKAVVYGLSVNYSTTTAFLYKLTQNFAENSFDVLRMKEEMTLADSINYMIDALLK